MNYHYTEFMVNERQKLRLEEIERKRMLRMANSQNNFSPKIMKILAMTLSQFTAHKAVRK